MQLRTATRGKKKEDLQEEGSTRERLSLQTDLARYSLKRRRETIRGLESIVHPDNDGRIKVGLAKRSRTAAQTAPCKQGPGNDAVPLSQTGILHLNPTAVLCSDWIEPRAYMHVDPQL